MGKMNWRTYSERDFRKAVEESSSIAQVLNKLGLEPAGGNYWSVKRKAKLLQIPTDHFTGQRHLKGKTHDWSKRIPLDEIMVEDSDYHTYHLRNRLIKEGQIENKCTECGITEWRGKSIQCELDHKNGKSTDHRKENLRMLCPNCHSQTENFRKRKKRT